MFDNSISQVCTSAWKTQLLTHGLWELRGEAREETFLNCQMKLAPGCIYLAPLLWPLVN